MKNLIRMLAALLICVGLFYGCGQDKYDQVIEYNEQFINITQNYIDGLNSAKSADDVAEVMTDYAEGFGKLMPKMQEINEKFPELMNQKDLPEKVIESQAKAEQIGMAFASSFMKSMQYMSDPKVAEAQKKMGEIMQSFSK